MSYLTLAEAKLWISSSQPTDDALLTGLITAVQDLIEGPKGINRSYEAAADTTHSFDAVRDVEGRALYLDADLCQITSITNGDGQLITSSQYVTETAGGDRNKTPWRVIRLRATATVQWLASATTGPENAIAIAGRWAYSIAPPARIKQLATEIVAYEYRRRASSGDADRPLLTGDGVTIMPADLPRLLMAQLMAERTVT